MKTVSTPHGAVSAATGIVFPEPLHASKVSAEVLPIAVLITSLKGASRISVEAHGFRITVLYFILWGLFYNGYSEQDSVNTAFQKNAPTHAVVIFGISIQFALDSFYSC